MAIHFDNMLASRSTIRFGNHKDLWLGLGVTPSAAGLFLQNLCDGPTVAAKLKLTQGPVLRRINIRKYFNVIWVLPNCDDSASSGYRSSASLSYQGMTDAGVTPARAGAR
jgi:hypothetical protein